MMYSTNSDVGTKVSFSPFILIGAAIFTFITVMIASMKPAKIAGSVSPIAAIQYTAASTKSIARNCSKMKLSRMAWNNFFRNAKSTTPVSYTHLDVYKRQAIAEQQKSRVDPMYHEKIDHLLDTYARKLAENIDVYKRQVHFHTTPIELPAGKFLLCLFGKLFDTGLYPADLRLVVG